MQKYDALKYAIPEKWAEHRTLDPRDAKQLGNTKVAAKSLAHGLSPCVIR